MPLQCTCSACGRTYEREPARAGKYCSFACFNSRPRKGIPDEERFWRKVDRSGGSDACWPWIESTDERGRGMFGLGGKKILAARHAWELTNGPIPNGLCLLHRCDRPGCCNPAHHWLGTQLENIADRNAKGREARGERIGVASLNEAMVREIRARWAEGGCTIAYLAAEYDVVWTTMFYVVNRITWRHVD